MADIGAVICFSAAMTETFSPDDDFVRAFDHLLEWRRDVRHFKPDPLAAGLLEELIARANLAPSVGNSQPWRFVSVESESLRTQIVANFCCENEKAAAIYQGERRALYENLKLAGLKEAPVHLAVFTDMETDVGHGLGRQTMSETLVYSTVCAIHTLWLAARARGLGLGWVSILDADKVTKVLDVPEAWKFVAYLCIGFPVENHKDPELQRRGWQARTDGSARLMRK